MFQQKSENEDNLSAYADQVPPGTFGDLEERQLSSEIERLGIGNHLEQAGFLPRGNDRQPKKESTREPCMYSMQESHNAYYGTQETNPQFPFVQGAMGPPSMYGIQGEMTQRWQPVGSQGVSLTSDSLEMDKAASMTSAVVTPPLPFQLKQESSFENCCQEQQHSFDSPLRQVKYPFDSSLTRYGGPDSQDSETEHQKWQKNHQSFSQPSSVENQPVYTPMEDDEVVHDFEPDENGDGPLQILSQVQDKTVMARVIDTLQKCQVVGRCINHQNKHKQTPLFLAVQAANIPLIGWLINNGADPNIQGTMYTDRDSYLWRAPLHLAVMLGDSGLNIIRLLLKSPNTNINITSYGDKLTPLHVALKCHREYRNCQQVVYELLDHQANIDIREQSSSKTPFILAIETRDISLIQGFLEKFRADRRRAILQDQTRAGDSCLHIAAGLSQFPSSQKEFLLRYLVTQGANGNVQNNVKELPRDFARTEWDRIRNF